MRRENLFCAIEELREGLRSSNLRGVFDDLLRPAAAEELSRRRAAALEALKRYVLAAQRFSAPARELAGILDLEGLEDTSLWLDLLSLGTAPERKLGEWQQRIDFVQNALPRIARLFRPEPLQALFDATGDEGGNEEFFTDEALLSVVVIESERHQSTPERLMGVLESVSLLYGASADLEGLPADGLTVIACDSGVDKSFDFLGRARAVDAVKELVLSLWNSIVLHRGHRLENRIELIARDLPVIRRVEELKQGGKLSAEQAQSLERRLIEGASKFIRAGAMIPEIERMSYSPRELMAPAPRLSASGEPAAADAAPAGFNLENLSEGDRTTFLRLLELARGEATDDETGAEPDGGMAGGAPSAADLAPDPAASPARERAAG